jgi:hypothetical protein
LSHAASWLTAYFIHSVYWNPLYHPFRCDASFAPAFFDIDN